GVDHEDGGYLVEKFCGRDLNVRARYVLLMFQPRGNYTFLDEIEVFGTVAKADAKPACCYPFGRQDLEPWQANLFRGALRSKALGGMAASLLRTMGSAAKTDGELMKIYHQIETI